MILYSFWKHIKCHYRRYIMLFLVLFSFEFICLFSYASRKINQELEEQITSHLHYEIMPKGRLCSHDSYNNYLKISDIDYEYRMIENYLKENEAAYSSFLKHIDFDKLVYTGIETSFFEKLYFYGTDVFYPENSNIEIIEGEWFKNDFEIVVNEKLRLQNNGDIFFPEVGDIIELFVSFQDDYTKNERRIQSEKPLSYTIVGKYKEKRPDVLSYDTDDYLLNQRLYVSKNTNAIYYQEFLNLLKEHPFQEIDRAIMPEIFFHNVRFVFDDYTTAKQRRDEIANFFHRFGEDQKYEIDSTINTVNGILSPFQELEKNTSEFFRFTSILSSFLIIFLISLSLYQKRKENAIIMTMGMSYRNTLLESVITTISITLLTTAFGYISFQMIFPWLVENILNDSIHLQNELLRISFQNSHAPNIIQGIDLSRLSFDVSSHFMLFTAMLQLTIVGISTVLLHLLIQPKNIKKSLLTSTK